MLKDNQIPKYLTVDENLVLRMQKGELEAFQAFYEQYYDWMFNFVRLHIDEYEDVKDITSQTLHKANEKICTLKDRSKFHTWLFNIARNEIKMFYRDKKYESESLRVMSEIMVEPDKNPTIENVREVLKKLKPPEQEILKLYYLNDVSVAELVKIIGKTEPAVRKLIERTLDKFKKLYEQR